MVFGFIAVLVGGFLLWAYLTYDDPHEVPVYEPTASEAEVLDNFYALHDQFVQDGWEVGVFHTNGSDTGFFGKTGLVSAHYEEFPAHCEAAVPIYRTYLQELESFVVPDRTADTFDQFVDAEAAVYRAFGLCASNDGTKRLQEPIREGIWELRGASRSNFRLWECNLISANPACPGT